MRAQQARGQSLLIRTQCDFCTLIGPLAQATVYIGGILLLQVSHSNTLTATFYTPLQAQFILRYSEHFNMAPKAEKKPAKKVAKKVAGGKGKKGKTKVESFKIYIYKVLKQVRSTSLS